MHLTYRQANPADIPACDWNALDGFADAPHLLSHVPQVWRRLMAGGGLIMMLVEDADRPPDQRVVWHGGSLFVAPMTLAEARQSIAPGIAARVTAAALAGNSPGLTTAQICRANAREGLHLLGLHYALSRALDAGSAWLVRAKAIEAYHAAFEGYRLQEILIEAYGEERCRVMQAGGFCLRSDYGNTVTGAQHPSLFGVTREEALADEGSVIASLFAYTPPRFGFKPGEQEMLCRALTGETDGELAANLCVSPCTIKTRWRTIYDRVQCACPGLLPATTPHGEQHRGTEKRRRLLTYLRHHPEEMRPCLPAKKS